MDEQPSGIEAENECLYKEQYERIQKNQPRIRYSDKDNENVVRKYDGYIRIYKKKQDSSNPTKQYFESPLVKDIVKNKGIQFSGDMVEKAMKTYKIKEQYGTNVKNYLSENLPDLATLEEKFLK